jgi:small GTP-binding protein
VVLLGEGRVGKTSLLLRYVNNIFSDTQPATIQASYLTKRIAMDGMSVQLAIWDTAGQERFHALGQGGFHFTSSSFTQFLFFSCAHFTLVTCAHFPLRVTFIT